MLRVFITLQYKITMLDDEMQRMNINLEAIESYRQKDADYCERVKELEAATEERDKASDALRALQC